MSVRNDLVAQIREVVGDTAAVIDVEDNKDVLGRMTVMVKQRRLLRLPEAPDGAMRVEFLITITHPAIAPAVSEPELDDFVPSFLDDMGPCRWFGWVDAVKNTDALNIAYDIDAWVIGGPTAEEVKE